MLLTLPEQEDDAQRMRQLVQRLAKLPIGRAIINTIINDPDLATPVHLAFDRQMDSMGMCYRNPRQCTVALDPKLDDATLVGVLAHELCHVIQPAIATDWSRENAGILHLAKSRMMEGDAFTHQFVLALGTDDHEVNAACMKTICGKLPTDERAYYMQLAENFLAATTPQEQQAVLSDIFWRIQQTRLDGYDDDILTRAQHLQQNRQLTPMAASPLHQASEFAASLMFIAARLPGVKYNNYLGDDPEDTAATVLNLASATQSLRQGVSIDVIMQTLPYSKPAPHATLKQKM